MGLAGGDVLTIQPLIDADRLRECFDAVISVTAEAAAPGFAHGQRSGQLGRRSGRYAYGRLKELLYLATETGEHVFAVQFIAFPKDGPWALSAMHLDGSGLRVHDPNQARSSEQPVLHFFVHIIRQIIGGY